MVVHGGVASVCMVVVDCVYALLMMAGDSFCMVIMADAYEVTYRL